ncbi:MAG: hypothetical protein DRQ55_12125 [Planctomycetota bacterium]|nr:MAG: hypothetical protein DRQ55_12125 [Planctomycetota bacterium]
MLAVLRALWAGPDQVPATRAGEPVPLRLETLEGAEFRLLPGVGPVLAGRLEQARQAAGGALSEAAAQDVRGVGEVLLERWRAVRLAGEESLR